MADRLVARDAPGASTYSYTYGRTDRNGLPLLETLTKNGNVYQFDYDQAGTPVSLRTQSGNRNFFVLDGHGSVVNLVKDDGSVSGTYTYDPYGDPVTATGTGGAVGINVHRYALGLADTDTGWTKHGIRWNDTTTGTWTTQDPLSRLLDPNNGNRYNYAGSNPINYLDPTGALSECAESLIPLVAEIFTVTVAAYALIAAGGVVGALAITEMVALEVSAGLLPFGIDSVVEDCG